MKTNNIVCGKLDSRISFGELNSHDLIKAVRISAPNPNKIKEIQYAPFATDGREVYYREQIFTVDHFLEMVATQPNFCPIVLTTKEYFKILEKATLNNIKITIFEIEFPIIDGIKYSSSPRTNFNVLLKLLKKISHLKLVGGSLSRDQTSRHLYSIARKLRFKNGFDQFFFFAYREGYQEVFRLKEERRERKIIALDFNSMFADCMKGSFCEPRAIYYVKTSRQIDPFQLEQGIYHVILKGAKDSFFLNHHPFLFKRLRKSNHFKLEVGDSVEIVLYKDEIICYQNFFEEIEVLEGFCSKETVSHPLYDSAVQLYRRRKIHQLRGNTLMANFCRTSIQFMHSSTNQRSMRRKNFTSLHSGLSFLSKEFQLNIDSKLEFSHLKELFKKNSYFKIEDMDGSIAVDYLDIRASNLLYSLSSKIISNSRIKMVEVIARLLKHKSVEICYANIDSIHISIDSSEIENFLKENSDLINAELGCLKVQAIADQGYWFDVGRYWLKKNNEVVLFKNRNFNHKGAKEPYIRKRKVVSIAQCDAFTHSEQYTFDLENSFSYSKRVKSGVTDKTLEFERFSFFEMENIETANITESTEILKSKRVKVDLFNQISARLSESHVT